MKRCRIEVRVANHFISVHPCPSVVQLESFRDSLVELKTEIIISPDATVVALELAAGLYQSGLRISGWLQGGGM
jgi:hypothetical protein